LRGQRRGLSLSFSSAPSPDHQALAHDDPALLGGAKAAEVQLQMNPESEPTGQIPLEKEPPSYKARGQMRLEKEPPQKAHRMESHPNSRDNQLRLEPEPPAKSHR
jgi:hypothetical protein